MYIFCYKSRVKAEFDSLAHKRQNMWLQKADERTLRMTGLQHDAANIYIGGMHLPDGEGQRLIVVAFSKFNRCVWKY